VGGDVITYGADGVLDIHDPRATLQVLAHGLRTVTASHHRGLASCCAQWLYSACAPVMAAPDVPATVVEKLAITVAGLAVLHGDVDNLGVIAAYSGIHGLRRRDALADLLWQPAPSLLRGIDAASHPMGYLVATVQQRMAAQARVDPQAHMVALDDLRRDDDPHGDDERRRDDELRHLVLTTPGIDTDEYLNALRSTGSAADLRLAHDLNRWLHGATQHELGEAAYRRMMRHLRGQRARVIGNRTRGLFVRGSASQEGFFTVGTRLDSVWHRQNAGLVR
jgi:hypothetical protein